LAAWELGSATVEPPPFEFEVEAEEPQAASGMLSAIRAATPRLEVSNDIPEWYDMSGYVTGTDRVTRT
jgi:hypothetical protein